MPPIVLKPSYLLLGRLWGRAIIEELRRKYPDARHRGYAKHMLRMELASVIGAPREPARYDSPSDQPERRCVRTR